MPVSFAANLMYEGDGDLRPTTGDCRCHGDRDDVAPRYHLFSI